MGLDSEETINLSKLASFFFEEMDWFSIPRWKNLCSNIGISKYFIHSTSKLSSIQNLFNRIKLDYFDKFIELLKNLILFFFDKLDSDRKQKREYLNSLVEYFYLYINENYQLIKINEAIEELKDKIKLKKRELNKNEAQYERVSSRLEEGANIDIPSATDVWASIDTVKYEIEEYEFELKQLKKIRSYNPYNDEESESIEKVQKTALNEKENEKDIEMVMIDHSDNIKRILSRFHIVAKQLRRRHKGRPAFEINDEYDVQDLLHALLKIYFDDIRTEEYTPSYAEGSSRMDFLIKNEKIGIEVKKTRKNMSSRNLGNQLIEDIARFRGHPDCKILLCFVYDPDGILNNPVGIETDLSRRDGDLIVKVYIFPKGT